MCAIRINSNTLALVAQRNLSRATGGVASAFERLASGQRINRASDDAAGLSIASQLNTAAKLYSQAVRNISDGISGISIASSAYSQLSQMNARMRELAEQSANGVYSAQQREALDGELQALIAEHNRIVNSTTFNGRKLITGDAAGISLQVGIDSTAASVLTVDTVEDFARTVGTGAFSAPASYGVGAGPGAVVSADFNGDGRADVVTANGGAGNVSILFGQADGTLGAAANFGVTAAPIDIAAGDFNGDGHLDLVTADNGGGAGTTASVLLNNGSGGFVAGGTLGAGAGPLAVATADLNNDGLVDIITAAAGGGSAASANFGSGAVEISSVTTAGTGTAEVTSLTVVGTPVQEVVQIVAATAGGGASTQEISVINAVSADPGSGDLFLITQFTGLDWTSYNPPGGPGTEAAYWTVQGVTDADSYYFWYDVQGMAAMDPGLVNPALAGYTGVRVLMFPGETPVDFATWTWVEMQSLPGMPFIGPGNIGNELHFHSPQPIIGFSTGNITDLTFTAFGGGSPLEAGDYFTISSTTTDYAVWFQVDSVGTAPVGSFTPIQVNVSSSDTADQVASAIEAALEGIAGGTVFSASTSGSQITVTHLVAGAVNDIADVNVGAPFAVAVSAQGSTGGGGTIAAGDHFYLNSPTTQYYGWFRVDGAGADPGVAGRTGIQIDILSTDDEAQVAEKMRIAISGVSGTPFNVIRVNDTLTITNTQGGSVADASDINVGAPFAVTTTTQGTSPGITAGSYFTVDTPSTDYYVWFRIGGTGADPMVAGRTGIQVNLAWGDDANTVAAAVAAALDPLGPVNASSASSTVTITNAAVGSGAVGSGTTSNFSISTLTDGSGSAIASGQYFLFSSPTTDYYGWYNLDGAGGNPGLAGRTGVQINVSSGQTAAQIAAATSAAIDALGDFSSSAVGSTLSITNTNVGNTADIGNGTMGGGFSSSVTSQGASSPVNVAADTIQIAGHGFSTGDEVQLSSTGTLPGGVSAGPSYYVIALDANTIRLAASEGDALGGIHLDLSSSGTGTHSIQGTGAAAGIRVFLNSGGGTFAAPTAFNLGMNPADIAFGDLNGDGIQDLVAVDRTQNVVRTMLGRGDGTFEAAASYATGATPVSVAVADLDNDGRADVVTADSGANALSVFLSRPDGTLGARTVLAAGSGPSSVAAGDVNGDGVADLAVGYAGSGETGIFINDTRGGFAAAAPLASGTSPAGVAFGDIDGDGALDVITANSGSSNVTVGLAVTNETTELALFNIRTQERAWDALDMLSEIHQRIVAQQGRLGALESRLSATLQVHASSVENHRAAESRILDADVATEASELLRSTILQQAGQLVLAQANIQPRLALQLLGA